MFCRNCGKGLVGAPEYCMNCGARPMAATSFCNNCGNPTTPLAEICVKCGIRLAAPQASPVVTSAAQAGVSPKSRLAAALLAFFLGGLGIHRFYVGKTGTAVTMLIFTVVGVITIVVVVGWIFLVAVRLWGFVDLIRILFGNFKDKDGRLLSRW